MLMADPRYDQPTGRSIGGAHHLDFLGGRLVAQDVGHRFIQDFDLPAIQPPFHVGFSRHAEAVVP
jgi:hypothetical protein